MAPWTGLWVSENHPDSDLSIIERAYVYSARVHHGQLRLSGEPYLSHPLEVAGILAEMKLDTVSVVADVVGGSLFPAAIDVLERGGRYTCTGAIAGPIVELDLRTFYLRDLTFTGATIVPPGTFQDLVSYIEQGEIKPLLAATYPLCDLAIAQAEFIRKQHIGNIVVTI